MSVAVLRHQSLFRTQQVRSLDRSAIENEGISGARLMARAGCAAFQFLRRRWPNVRRVLIVCGVGNNAGDGYVVARYAKQAGLKVRVSQVGDVGKLSGDALGAYEAMCQTGLHAQAFGVGDFQDQDLIVDAIFGTGLSRAVADEFLVAIEGINASSLPVFALDVPSGLDSDTGALHTAAVRAHATASFVALKQGMFTGFGPSCCGDIELNELDIPESVYATQRPSARLTSVNELSNLLPQRERHAHKGNFGHVLVVGSDIGYTGAARLAGEAAARVGSGLISIATRAAHAATIAGERAELMTRGVESQAELSALISNASVLAIGPGLGQGRWGRTMLETALACDLPFVVDADALNLLAGSGQCHDRWVLTPHPGEAGRLLGVTSAEVQNDRFKAAEAICECYGGVVVLKGAGTLVACVGETTHVCPAGNPGMGSGGMGDVLTGVIAGLVAQNLSLFDAASLGVCLHAQAGDTAAIDGERGMLARDLMPILRRLVNP